jgi:hypothetical protein
MRYYTLTGQLLEGDTYEEVVEQLRQATAANGSVFNDTQRFMKMYARGTKMYTSHAVLYSDPGSFIESLLLAGFLKPAPTMEDYKPEPPIPSTRYDSAHVTS